MYPLNRNEKVFIIVPAFNEQEVIRNVVSGLLDMGYSVIVVDDGSAENLQPALQNLPVYLLRHPVNLGQGAAIQTGMEFAILKQAEILVTFDADGQHSPADIPRLVEMLSSGKLDIVTGSRFMKGSVHNLSAGRTRLLKFARYLNYFFTGLLLSDAHNGLRAFTRGAAGSIHLHENGMAHATEILAQIKKKKLRHCEIPVTINYTNYSRGKGQSAWNSFRIFFDLILNKLFK